MAHSAPLSFTLDGRPVSVSIEPGTSLLSVLRDELGLLGTIIGVLPGIGPVTTVAMLLPISFTLAPESALILLAGIYYGAQYGGSTTAILVNIPGESSSVVTCLDGYQMARKGQAVTALATAALGSFFAGSVATVFIATVATPATTAPHSRKAIPAAIASSISTMGPTPTGRRISPRFWRATALRRSRKNSSTISPVRMAPMAPCVSTRSLRR